VNASVDRWETYIKFNQDIFNEIVAARPSTILSDDNTDWNGIRLNQVNLDNIPNSYIAYAGPKGYDIEGANSVKIVSTDFILGVNDYYKNLASPEDWVNVMTHELGHALGIGVYWGSGYVANGSVPPENYLLDGTAYTNTQKAFNDLVFEFDSNKKYTIIPVENTGGGGTINVHWENNERFFTNDNGDFDFVPGIHNEIMRGNIVQGQMLKISQISIQHLVDLGYEEVAEGSEESTLEDPTKLCLAFGGKWPLNIQYNYNATIETQESDKNNMIYTDTPETSGVPLICGCSHAIDLFSINEKIHKKDCDKE
jgi:hypothetical protein